MMQYYPLAPGNQWTYRQKDGSTYTNAVTAMEGSIITMKNSTVAESTRVKVENGVMYNELMAPGNFQTWMKDIMHKGDTWEAAFTANGLKSIMAFTVVDTGLSKEVSGTNYPDVTLLEAESLIDMNGNRISTQFKTQYYYAKGVGLIMTTSSVGDEHALVSCVLN